MFKSVILSTAYLAPIQYYTKLVKYKNVFIEMHENFVKQTYRNRCKIYAANGELSLSIPVKKRPTKTLIKDIYIDYDTNWQKMHWKSIESAYRSSPFFEFYEDGLKPFYHKKYKFLVDFNLEIQNVLLELLELQVDYKFTEEYHHKMTYEFDDFRDKINPKKKDYDPEFKPVNYIQVFQEKYGFLPNLSIIDLLFNEGTNAQEILIKG